MFITRLLSRRNLVPTTTTAAARRLFCATAPPLMTHKKTSKAVAAALYGTAAGVCWCIETSTKLGSDSFGLGYTILGMTGGGIVSMVISFGSPFLGFVWGTFLVSYREFLEPQFEAYIDRRKKAKAAAALPETSL